MAYDRLRALRQNDPDPVAPLHAERSKRVRELVRPALEVPVGPRGSGAGLVLPVEAETRAIPGVPPAARRGDVEPLRHLPTVAAIDLLVAVHALSSRFRPRRQRSSGASAKLAMFPPAAETRSRLRVRGG